MRLQAGNGLQQLLLPAARNARHAQDFAGKGLKIGVGEHLAALAVGNGHIGQAQLHHGVYGLGPLNVQLHLLANHHFGQAHFGGVARVNGTDAAPLAQHRHAVAEGKHLV